MRPRLFAARAILPRPGEWIEDGGLLVAGGRIVRVLRSRSAVRRAASGSTLRDLGDCLLAPGLVNAHAHLELSLLGGVLPRASFLAWIRALIASREKLSSAELERAVTLGANRLAQTGTTSVGDIDSTGACARLSGKLPLRIRLFREVLDAGDPTRTERALARVARALPRRKRTGEGISPHAPHTASEEMLARVASLARARSIQVAVHWSETMEERDWLEQGRGPFKDLLPPRRSTASGLECLAAAGLLSQRTALIHGNHPARGEPERLARAGVVVVHCPGTHAFFDRDRFPWRKYRIAGVHLALGTDSLASNTDLDLRAEMKLARARASWLDPADVFAMATLEGARALGWQGQVGELASRACADFAMHVPAPRSARQALERLTCGDTTVAGVWLGGRRIKKTAETPPKRPEWNLRPLWSTVQSAERLASSRSQLNSSTQDSTAAALDLIRASRRFLLVGHVRPDGDVLGSQVALKGVLESIGKKVVIQNPDPPQPQFDYLGGPETFGVYQGGELPAHDVACLLDFCDVSRCGPLAEQLVRARSKKLVVDHHLRDGAPWWDACYVDQRAAATGVLVRRIARDLGTKINLSVALGIFTSLVADTGWFKYSNTDVEALAVASEMVSLGVEPNRVFEALHQRADPSQPKALARALNTLEYHADGTVALVALPRAQAGEPDLADGDEALDILRAVNRVGVVLFLRELPDGRIKLSARSKGSFDVNALTRCFGGGGHRKASGATLPGPLSQARARVVDATLEQLARGERAEQEP